MTTLQEQRTPSLPKLHGKHIIGLMAVNWSRIFDL
jgi:hypothetical protein